MGRLSLAKRFFLWSLLILVVGMAGIGLWVSHQIEAGIVHRTASTTALYVDSLIAPPLQELTSRDTLSPTATKTLDSLLGETPLGQRVAVFRVWDPAGTVIYSTDPATIGEHFPVDAELADALRGKVSADIGDIEGEVHLGPGLDRHDLLEIYSPVRSSATGEIIAVAEFYYGTDDVRGDVMRARLHTWLVVGGATLLIYIMLAAFVQRSSDTIARQQRALAGQVGRLTDLLGQNEELHQRVRSAAARTTALNERFLRRFSAELHDGPAQDISLALFQLDHAASCCQSMREAGNDCGLGQIQDSLQHALQEVRDISAGLMLPQLGELHLADVIEHAAQAHRRRTRSAVAVQVGDLGPDASLATKIAVYRIVQEALTNAWRHAGGRNQRIEAERVDGEIRIIVSDGGPGFDPARTMSGAENHLGMLGMRERVETLGGEFRVESSPESGTRVLVTLPLRTTGERDA